MTRRSTALAALAVLAGAPGAPALTETETQTVFEHSWVVLNKDTEAAQTFRIGAGNAGTIGQVSVYLSAAGDASTSADGTLHVELWSVDGGLPDAPITGEQFDIGTVLAPQGVLPKLFLVALTNPVQVAVNDELAVVLRITGGAEYATRVVWAGSDTDTYANGEALSRTIEVPPDPWTSYASSYDIDRCFRIYNE